LKAFHSATWFRIIADNGARAVVSPSFALNKHVTVGSHILSLVNNQALISTFVDELFIFG
jgi:hypothetical protein